jgi:3-oxoacid CoA-transferase subunit A
MMAQAATFTIAEVDELADQPMDPDTVHTPGNYIDRVVRTRSEKRIEQRTTRS